MTARSLIGAVAAAPLLYAWPLTAQRYIAEAVADSTVRLLCSSAVEVAGADALLRREVRLSDAATRQGREPDSETLWELSCHRALLAVEGAIGRTGYRMPLGASWREGATNTALMLSERTPDGDAPALIALLNPDPVLGAEPVRLIGPYREAVRAGNPVPVVARACTSSAFRLDSTRTARECSIAALQAGQDSTFHLLALARFAAVLADTAASWQHLLAATRAMATPDDRAYLDWHLHWMLEPDEFSDWQSRPDSGVYAFVRNAFLERDLRDGRAPGSRAVEHFQRLAMADREFRMYPLPIHRRRLISEAAMPDVGEGTGANHLDIDAYDGGSNDPAYTMREYRRWQTDYDDRGVVWMRFGEPMKRHYYSAFKDGGGNYIRRETWRYDIDGTQLLLSFESEKSDGSEEATRLVSGVIGEHFCGIDNRSCIVGTRSWAAGWFNFLAGRSGRDRVGITIGERMEIRERDRNQIVEATTKDDNSQRFEKDLEVLSHGARIWQPGTNRELILFPWAIKSGDLSRQQIEGGAGVELALELRSYDSGSGLWWDTTVVKRLRLPPDLRNDAHITGVIAAPVSHGATSWSLLAHQGADRGGRVFDTSSRPLGSGPLVLSDLVVGSERQGLLWNGTVPLAPLGAVDRKQPVSLYFQIRSAQPHNEAVTTVTVYRTRRDKEEAAIALSFEGRISAGLTEVQRNLGLDRLDRGDYRLEVKVRTASGVEAVRSTPLYLR